MEKAYRNFLVKLFTIGIYIVYYEAGKIGTMYNAYF